MSYNDRRKFESDVFYEAWVRGYDAERAAQCADDCYWNHRTPEQCVDDYGARVRAEHERQDLARMEEEDHYGKRTRAAQISFLYKLARRAQRDVPHRANPTRIHHSAGRGSIGRLHRLLEHD
jgi:N-methylhydantoinase B/oxoprolinase/acetone carboxylase alpha subunit